MAQAKASGKPVVVTAATTDRTTTTALPNGKFELDEYVNAQRVKLNGAWTPLDTTLATGANGTVSTKATTYAVQVSSGGTSPMAVVNDRAGHTLTVTFPVPLPKPVLSGDVATYSNVYPGTDLVLTASAVGVSDVLVVKDAAAAANPALKTLHFGITGNGVTVSTGSDGSIHAKDAAGKDIFSSATPQMWDSTGAAPAASPSGTASRAVGTKSAAADETADPGVTGVHAKMPAWMSGNGISLTPDQALLTGAVTKFPVYMDPQFTGNDINNWLEVYQAGNRGYYDGQGYVSANLNVARVGWNAPVGATAGAVRSLVEFSATVVPYGNQITEADVVLPHDAGGNSCTGAVQLWRTNPIYPGETWSGAVDSSTNKFSGQTNPVATTYCDSSGNLTFNDTQQFEDMYSQGKSTATVGIQQDAENSSRPQIAFWVQNNAVVNAHLQVFYDSAPQISSIWPSGQSCGTDSSPAVWSRTAALDYTLNANVAGDGASHDLQVSFNAMDHSNGYSFPGPIQSQTSGYSGSAWTLLQGSLPVSWLTDGHLYELSATVRDVSSNLSDTADPTHCWFIPDMSPPAQPTITTANDANGNPAYPQLATGGASTQAAGVPFSGAFNVSSTVTNPYFHIDHFAYAINADASLSGNPASCPAASECGSIAASNNSAAISLNSAVTHWGANYLWVEAVDSTGNTSAWAEYDFFVPAPFVKTTWGNVTGNEIPDIVSIAPDPANPAVSDLVSFPTNLDPSKSTTTGWAGNWIQSAPAANAPDGTTWAGTLITHRGADRVVPYDDLFAWKNGALYYFLNTLTGTSNPTNSPVDAFAKTRDIVVTRPAAPACNPGCDYAPDWSNVQQILAIGPAAGGAPGTFAGKTSLVTVEDDGHGGANVWLFHPAGIGQLQAPVLIASCSTQIGTEQGCPAGWNWRDTTLIAPGNAAGHPLINGAANSGMPDLWVRDKATGTLWQFPNRITGGVEDPTGLGDFATRSQLGGGGQFSVGNYQQLFADSNVLIDPVNGPDPGPSLWGLSADGTLTLIRNPAAFTGNTPVPAANIAAATGSSWPSSFQMNTADTAQITPAAGSLTNAVSSTGNQICLDNQGDNLWSGNPVQTYTCNGGSTQSWTLTGSGAVEATRSMTTSTPMCLDTLGSRTAGAAMQIGPCDGAASQTWRTFASTAAPSLSLLYNPGSGLCLDDPGASSGSGTRLDIATCSDIAEQQWMLPKAAGNDLAAEAETLGTSNAGVPLTVQTGSEYSNNGQLFMAATAVGAHFTMSYYVPVGGVYRVTPAMTKAVDYGQYTLTVDSQTMPNTFDGYAASFTNPAPFYFGTMALAAGWHTFTFTATGTNAASTGNRYQIGVDTLNLAYTQVTSPVAALSLSGSSVPAPAPVTADATGSAPGGAAITRYSFDFGDGTVIAGTSSKATHGYLWNGTPNTYTITVTISDAAGKSSTASQTITITAPTPPTAKVDASAKAPVNVPVPISAASSTPGSSAITTYTVNYGDGTALSTGNAPLTMHTYTAAGTYTVTLTETDQENLSSTATTSITVGALPGVGYVGRIASDASAPVGGTRTVGVHSATDTEPDDAIVVSVMVTSAGYGNVTATDTAGDVFTKVADISDGGGGAGSDRTVILAAFKTRGLNLSDTVNVVFPNAAEHHVTIDEYSGIKGVDTSISQTGPNTTSFTSGALTPSHAGDMLVAVAGLQNSTTPSLTSGWTALPSLSVPTGQNPDWLITGYHTASGTGASTASGTSNGVWMAAQAAFLPNIVTAAISASPSGGNVPLPVTLNASGSSQGQNPITNYTFAFGDGTANVSGTAATVSHTYTAAGAYAATVTVTDSAGATDTASTTIYAVNPPSPPAYNGQKASDASGTTTTSVALHPVSAVSAGDTLLLPMMLTSSNAVNPTGSITASDTQGNTYTQVGTATADNGGDYTVVMAATAIKHGLSTTDTITVNWPSNAEHHIAVEDFSGVNAVDQTSAATGAAGTFSSGKVVTGNANEILYGFAGIQGGSDGAWGTGWTDNPTLFVGSDQLMTATQTVTATGTYQATGTAAATWLAGIVTLRYTANSPSAALSVPSTATVNAPVTANASASTPGTNPIATYAFDFGDGYTTSGTSSSVSHAYTMPGNYTVKVTVTDTQGMASTTQRSIIVSVANPTAALTLSPSSAQVAATVTANASGSKAGSYPISTYAFTFGDGYTVAAQAGSSATHAYTTAGTYTVTVTVTDTQGNTATTTATEQVTNVPPPPSIAYLGRITAGSVGTTTVTSATMPVTRAVTAGNTVIISAMLTNQGTGTVSASDTQGNTYKVVEDRTDGSKDYTLILVATSIKALSTTDTITLTFPSTGEHHIVVDAFSGVSSVDQHTSATGPATSSFNSGATATTTAANELVFGVAGIQGGSATWTSPTTGLPTLYLSGKTSGDQLDTAYQIVTVTGGYAASGTSNHQWMAAVVTLK